MGEGELIMAWLGLAARSFVEGKSVRRLEEWVQVGKGEDSNKEPSISHYAQGRLSMVSWAGSEEMEWQSQRICV